MGGHSTTVWVAGAAHVVAPDCFVARAPRNDGWVAADPNSVLLGFTNSIVLRERLRSTGIVARRRQSGGLAILIPSHATLRKFRSAGLEAVKRTRLGVCFRDILRLYSPFLVADASARQRAKYNQQQRLCHRTTLPLTQLLEVSAIFVSEMWIQELKFSSTRDFRGGSGPV